MNSLVVPKNLLKRLQAPVTFYLQPPKSTRFISDSNFIPNLKFFMRYQVNKNGTDLHSKVKTFIVMNSVE